MAAQNRSFRIRGIVYLEDDTGRLRDVGNVSAMSYSAEEETIALANYRTAAGGNYNSDTRVSAVNISMTLHDLSAENLALGLFGGVTDVAAGTVTDEAQTTPSDVSVDCLVPTDHVINTAEAVTVTGYAEGTDFVKTGAGIIVLASGSIPADTALAISYTKLGGSVVEAFIKAAQDRRVVLDGVNVAQNGEPIVINIWRFKSGPASDTDFIGDEFGAIPITGEALPDPAITASDESAYLQVKVA